MAEETRKQHWEQVYQNRSDDDVSWYQRHPERSLEYITQCDISKQAPIMDAGGGASRLVDCLLQQGYSDVSVMDIARAPLRLGERRLGAQARRVHWIESDVTQFIPPRRYTLWHDRAVFHFLVEPDKQQAYRRMLERALSEGGHLILAAFAPDGPTMCSNLPIQQHDADSVTALFGQGFELLSVENDIHVTPANKAQSFNWFHLRYRPHR